MDSDTDLAGNVARRARRGWLVALSAAAALTTAGLALAQNPPPPVANPPVGDAEAGARLVKQYCAACHGPVGRGGSAPSFVGSTWRHGYYDAQLTRSIRDGYPDLGMPAWGAVLNSAQINDIIAFIRKNPLPSTAAKGPGELSLPPQPFPTGVVRTAQESFRLEKIAKTQKPYALAFLPDGRLLITQVNGELRVFDHGKLLPEPVAGTPSGPAPQDAFGRRMLDVRPHPAYKANGWIYLTWARQEPGIVGSDGARIVLSRGRIKDGRWVDNQDIMRARTGYAQAARIAFDGQGHVFLSIENAEWPSRPEQAPAQDLGSRLGKILRMTEDGGVPADNPFVGQTGADPYVWSLGHRNPMGLAFDRAGRLWEVENGPHGGDEVNLIQRGANYGWPKITWGLRYDDLVYAAHPSEEGLRQPVISWSPSPAVAGIDFYYGDAFPRWKGSLFISSMKGRSLYRVVLNDQGQATLQETILFNLARFRDVKAGPDGRVYVLAENGDLLRLRPAR